MRVQSLSSPLSYYIMVFFYLGFFFWLSIMIFCNAAIKFETIIFLSTSMDMDIIDIVLRET